jgi:ferric-dicitrate binding protein FerR (iron transport regulator)
MLPGYFSGEISGEDRAIVDDWRAESPDNEEEFRQLQKTWDSYPLLQEMEKYNAFEALRKVNDRIREKESRRWTVSFQRIAAILIFPVLAYTGFLIFKNNSLKEVSKSEPVWQTISTPPGVKSRFFLPDSTAVWLNSSSSITYPVAFSWETRQVSIKGEAFLDVRKDQDHPFVVGLGKINVRVLGTRFDVINYENENKTDVILESGNISLFQQTGREEKVLTSLRPGEMAVFDKENNSLSIKTAQTEKYTAWKEGKLIFRDDPMDEVVRKLNRWFNVQIEVADPEISEYIYTATFRNESIDQILELLTISAPIRYQVIQREKKGDIFSAKQIILRKRK